MFSMTRPFGFAGERKAVSLLILAFYMAFFGLIALVASQNEEPEWARCFLALLACYGLGFFALASGWFWARWFAIGLGYSGLTTAIWGMISLKQIEPVMLFYGLTHGIVALFLQGERLIAQYDSKPEWRQQLGLDEEAVYRVRKMVTRFASGLPTLIMFALAPRGNMLGFQGTPLWKWALLGIAVAGLFIALRGRTLGLVLLLGSTFAFLMSAMNDSLLALHHPKLILNHPLLGHRIYLLGQLHASLVFVIVPAIALGACLIPFVKPILTFLKKSHLLKRIDGR